MIHGHELPLFCSYLSPNLQVLLCGDNPFRGLQNQALCEHGWELLLSSSFFTKMSVRSFGKDKKKQKIKKKYISQSYKWLSKIKCYLLELFPYLFHKEIICDYTKHHHITILSLYVSHLLCLHLANAFLQSYFETNYFSKNSFRHKGKTACCW